jgi:hypothetical protein
MKYEGALGDPRMWQNELRLVTGRVVDVQDIDVERPIAPVLGASSPSSLLLEHAALQQCFGGVAGPKQGDTVQEPSPGAASTHRGAEPVARSPQQRELRVGGE